MLLATASKFFGIRNIDTFDRLPFNALVDAVNVDIDKTGRIVSRSGYLKTVNMSGITGGCSDGTILLVQASGNLYLVNSDNTTSLLVSSLAGSGALSCVSVNGVTYWSNGTDTGRVISGVNYAWGLPVPSVPTVTQVSGSIPAGRYFVAVTIERSDGYESGCSVPIPIDLTSGGLRIATTAGSNVYLSHVNPDVSGSNVPLYYIGSASGGTLTYTADLYPSRVCLTSWKYPPPAGSLTYYKGRIWIASGAQLYCTDAYSFELVDYLNTFQFESNITGVGCAVDGLYISTLQAVYFMIADNPQEATLTKVCTTGVPMGGMAQTSQDRIGSNTVGAPAVVWLSENGIFMGIASGQVTNLTRMDYVPPTMLSTSAVVTDQQIIFSYL